MMVCLVVGLVFIIEKKAGAWPHGVTYYEYRMPRNISRAEPHDASPFPENGSRRGRFGHPQGVICATMSCNAAESMPFLESDRGGAAALDRKSPGVETRRGGAGGRSCPVVPGHP